MRSRDSSTERLMRSLRMSRAWRERGCVVSASNPHWISVVLTTLEDESRSRVEAGHTSLLAADEVGSRYGKPVELVWAVMDLNQRPPRCKRGALAN
jgi:hypothetical protein